MIPYILLAFLFLIGLPNALWPYKIARFSEQIDAIGSKRAWSEVEPADWKVYLIKWSGILLMIFAVIFVIMTLL